MRTPTDGADLVPTDRTLVTELASALGMVPSPSLRAALSSRSPVLHVEDDTWERLDRLHRSGAYERDFLTAYENGSAFAAAEDGLAGRAPRLIDWTGGRRPTGDEVAPIDLRIDHVYLVSCKYLSANIANPSPGRLFEGLLATTGDWARSDWYAAVAPEEYQRLYAACAAATGLADLPASAAELDSGGRKRLRRAIGDRQLPPEAHEAYLALCEAVSERSAERWRAQLESFDAERMLWRLLRIGNAPYFLLGAHGRSSLRLRVDTTWDWHQAYRLEELSVSAASAGQPRVDWAAAYRHRAEARTRQVGGHVEIRWSHGRFGQPPEAKVYLDTPVDEVPGYHPLEGSSTGALFEEDGAAGPSAEPPSDEVAGPVAVALF